MMDVAVDSQLYTKTLGCLVGGLIGDAIGTPTENMAYGDIEAKFGWVDDFEADGTDDTVMKNILADAWVQTGGYATIDDWGHEWLEQYDEIFGDKVGKFFQSVLHTAARGAADGGAGQYAEFKFGDVHLAGRGGQRVQSTGGGGAGLRVGGADPHL